MMPPGPPMITRLTYPRPNWSSRGLKGTLSHQPLGTYWSWGDCSSRDRREPELGTRTGPSPSAATAGCDMGHSDREARGSGHEVETEGRDATKRNAHTTIRPTHLPSSHPASHIGPPCTHRGCLQTTEKTQCRDWGRTVVSFRRTRSASTGGTPAAVRTDASLLLSICQAGRKQNQSTTTWSPQHRHSMCGNIAADITSSIKCAVLWSQTNPSHPLGEVESGNHVPSGPPPLPSQHQQRRPQCPTPPWRW